MLFMRRISSLICIFVFLILGLFPATVARAQVENPKPQLALVVSFQQGSVKSNAPVVVTIWISNQSDVPITHARLVVTKPEFLLLHVSSCDSPTQITQVELGEIPPRSTVPQPVSICFTLNRKAAIAGNYNILMSVVYRWKDGIDLVSVEKALWVDLIGVDAILGVPLAFAGFILPGLMMLVALRWFKVPVAKNLEPVDRLIYAILLSLVLLGPFSWLATRPSAPSWATWLDFQQQVSIERLVVYTLVGLLIGLIIGLAYWAVERRKARAAEFKASLQLKTGDQPPQLLKKALLLNPKYDGKRIFLQTKDSQHIIYGYHYAEYDKSLYVFAHFQLIISLLPQELQTKVHRMIDSAGSSGLDRKHLLAILDMLADDTANAFIIADPVVKLATDGKPAPPAPDLAYMIVDKDLYLPPQVDSRQSGCLLEVLEEMPY